MTVLRAISARLAAVPLSRGRDRGLQVLERPDLARVRRALAVLFLVDRKAEKDLERVLLAEPGARTLYTDDRLRVVALARAKAAG